MSNNKYSLQHKLVRQPLDEREETVMRRVSNEELKNYALMQSNTLKSEAYTFAKKYDLSEELAERVISIFKDVKKAELFTQSYKKLNGDLTSYIQAAEFAAKNNFSFTPKEISLLEQEVMNFEGKFNLNLTQTYHKDVPGSSSHYTEHFLSRTERQEERLDDGFH